MAPDLDRTSPASRRKQYAAIAAMLVLGLLLAALILRTGDGHGESGVTEGHAHGAAHADEEHHDTERDTGRQAEGAASAGAHEHGPERVALDEAQIRAAGLVLAQAGPARIRHTIRLPGEIRFNEDWTAHVVPRLAGVVQSVPASLGQAVKRGDVLAVLASPGLSDLRSEWLAAQKRLGLARTAYHREGRLWREKISAEQDYLQARLALQEAEIAAANARHKLAAVGAGVDAPSSGELSRYEIRAPFDGLVVEKHIANGEAVREDSNVFTISDLSSVWAEISVPASALDKVRVGATATVRAVAFDSQAEGKVSYVGALLGQDTRTAQAWVVLPNPDMAWRPGLFVSIELLAGDEQAAVAVRPGALHELEGRTVVFVREPGGFAAQPVVAGRRDADAVEIRQGLAAGAEYVAEGGFVLKSELGKSSAGHSH